ncbi:hypothetical protein ACFWTC_03135 [Streptomyces sp. NPDC058619]|uniref:hypothetical protein n=1 Tax=Streptomyces sp. NPDC058619 TaxID=3346559 RepID=UPI0036696C48
MADASITRIIPPGAPLPPRPPDPPGPPRLTLPDDWWRQPPPPRPPTPPPYTPPPPPPGQVDIHVTLSWAAPEPERPAWWRRIRWGYNAGCLLCAGPVSAPLAWALAGVRDSQGLAGAWTLAAIPIAVLTLLDNGRRVEAEHAIPELWAPKLRAIRARILLYAALTATATTLPATTLVYVLTGVRT